MVEPPLPSVGKIGRLGRLGGFFAKYSKLAYFPRILWSVWLVNLVRVFWTFSSPFLTRLNEAQSSVDKLFIILSLVQPFIEKLVGADGDILLSVNRFNEVYNASEKLHWREYLGLWSTIFGALIVVAYLVVGKKVPLIGWDISASNWVKRFSHAADANKDNKDYLFGAVFLYFSMYYVATKFNGIENAYVPFEGVWTLFKTLVTNYKVFVP